MTDDFSNALISFKKAEEANDINDSGLKIRIKTWINKSTLELGNENAGNINDSVYLQNDKPTQVVAPTSIPIPVIETQSVSTTESSTSEDAKNIKELSHDWYQNTEFVFLSILKKKIKGEAAISMGPDCINISFTTGEKFIVHLAHSINSEDSSFTQTDKKVELKLKKQEAGIVWDILSKEQASEKPKEARPVYPSSNPNKKNWEEVDKNCKKDLATEKDEENDAMNSLLKKIYSGADEETRRAMIKSYQTSNGTVLSTSWGDVRDKDYEGKDYVSPPDHFIAKKPEY
jgi:suppressor of G2 allele of SKP1